MHEHDHGHEHHHNHDDCCCGHDQKQEHHHHHDDDDCCYGHDQEQEHHHHHDGDCCCGHHHEHEHHHHDGCCCGHDHDHEAEAQEDVPTRSHTHFVVEHVQTPGHPADCQCPLCNHHAEYCDICGESLAKCTCKMPDEDLEKRVYILEGIDCANCAAKIEAKIRSMPEVAFAAVSFATKQLRITAENPDALIDEIRRVSVALEPEVTIVERDSSPKSAAKDAAAKSAKEEDEKKERQELISIIIGAVLFVVGEILSHMGVAVIVTLPVFVIGYLILGAGILLTAAKNISHGQIFDENFLMSLARFSLPLVP